MKEICVLNVVAKKFFMHLNGLRATLGAPHEAYLIIYCLVLPLSCSTPRIPLHL